jgi:hypothetical protein
MNPSHVVPLFMDKNVNTSILPFVAVSVGAEPPDHLTLAGHTTVRCVPSAVKATVNVIELEVPSTAAGTFEIVMAVILAFNAIEKTEPLDKSNVSALAEIVGVVRVSGVIFNWLEIVPTIETFPV